MHRYSSRTRAQMVATLAALQPGIEPAALALLVANHAASPQDFGWIVSVGQIGMTGGALLGWRQSDAGRSQSMIGPAIGVLASLALPIAHGLFAVLALRLVLGFVMGLLLTRATAIAARERPHNAIGIIYLAQQLIATAVLAGLPIVAAAWGPAFALCTLTAAPLAIALLLRKADVAESGAQPAFPRDVPAPDAGRVRMLVPMALIIAVTMMLWSYVATIGAALGLREGEIGFAIALGSLASAPAAALAALAHPRFPPWITALLCGAGMLSPLIVPSAAGLAGYVGALALFNAGSTFGAIRFVAWAMEQRAEKRQRRLVAMVQCVAMAGGPALGAMCLRMGGLTALGALATAGLTAAMLLTMLRSYEGGRRPSLHAALAA